MSNLQKNVVSNVPENLSEPMNIYPFTRICNKIVKNLKVTGSNKKCITIQIFSTKLIDILMLDEILAFQLKIKVNRV